MVGFGFLLEKTIYCARFCEAQPTRSNVPTYPEQRANLPGATCQPTRSNVPTYPEQRAMQRFRTVPHGLDLPCGFLKQKSVQMSRQITAPTYPEQRVTRQSRAFSLSFSASCWKIKQKIVRYNPNSPAGAPAKSRRSKNAP
ncbi:hypothetical protein Atep_30990 (plasmid) [Allochromatium tepidum]|uniref:Uncharacterized protein n=1 Tax=Allochromatium tepidum TaxID=553982 RepID=A0ABN6GEN8_9GAMM|nr:hypothetical protein Atep_30990 [Allochromatium tepidum]